MRVLKVIISTAISMVLSSSLIFTSSAGSVTQSTLNNNVNSSLKKVVQSVVQKRVKASNVTVDINKLSNQIFSELENNAGIYYMDADSLENTIVNKLTEKVGITGIYTFVQRDNAIFNAYMNQINEKLGIKPPQPKWYTNNFSAKIALITTLANNRTYYSLKKGAVKISYKATTSRSYSTKYNVSIYEKGSLFPAYKSSQSTSDYYNTDTFNISKDGNFYVYITQDKDLGSYPTLTVTGTLSQLR